MQAAIFIFYLFVVSYLITITPFFKKSAISTPVLLALFYIKVLAGIAYAFFYKLPAYYANSDTWRFYRLSLEEKQSLLKSPLTFLRDLFSHHYNNTGNIFSGENSYWNDLKSNVPVKIMATFNVLTNNSYYTDIILFNFLFLFGPVAIYKLLSNQYAKKKPLIIGSVFLLPSTLFWCSGIHKDGLILSATGLILYCCHKLLKERFAVKYLLIIFILSLLVFSLRNYVLFALIPSLLCWWLSEKAPPKKWPIFLTVYATGIFLFFAIPYMIPSLNFADYAVRKQQEFLTLPAESHVKTPPLTPTFASFVSYLPYALDMAFLRPHPGELKNFSYLPAIIENILIILLIIFCSFRLTKHSNLSPLVLCLLAFSVSVLLICGYTIPFSGAIVRYKSLVLPLLITPLLCLANVTFVGIQAPGKP